MKTKPNKKSRDKQLQQRPQAVGPEIGEGGDVQGNSDQNNKYTSNQSPTGMKKGIVGRCLLWCKRRFWESWCFDREPSFFDLITSIAAVFGLYFLVQQSCQTNSALREARNANQIASQFGQLERRAWLQIDVKVPEPALFKPIVATIGISNVGNTPARNVRGCVHVQALRNDEIPSFDLVNDGTKECPTYEIQAQNLFPGAATPEGIYQAYIGDSLLQMLDPVRHADWISRQMYVAVFAALVYTDVFGRPHWLRHCVSAEAQPRIVTSPSVEGKQKCVQFNDLDVEKTYEAQ